MSTYWFVNGEIVENGFSCPPANDITCDKWLGIWQLDSELASLDVRWGRWLADPEIKPNEDGKYLDEVGYPYQWHGATDINDVPAEFRAQLLLLGIS